VRDELNARSVLWGPYQTFKQLVESDPRASEANRMISPIDHPAIGSWLAASSPVNFGASARGSAGRAPLLGDHTDQVLRELLGFDRAKIDSLRSDGVIGPLPSVDG
jgi:2-methylfumaryl-CoA isomerase